MTTNRTSYWIALNRVEVKTTTNFEVAMATYDAIITTLERLGIAYTVKSKYMAGDAESCGWSFLNADIRAKK